MKHFATLPHRAGYTMIEMVMVLFVMGLLMLITISAMTPQIQHSRVNNAASVIVGDLQYAQSLAVRYRRPMAVIVQEATRQYTIQERDAPHTIYRIRHLGQDSDFSLESLSADPPTIELYPNGVALTTTEVTVGFNDYERRVRLTRAGQIRIVRD